MAAHPAKMHHAEILIQQGSAYPVDSVQKCAARFRPAREFVDDGSGMVAMARRVRREMLTEALRLITQEPHTVAVAVLEAAINERG